MHELQRVALTQDLPEHSLIALPAHQDYNHSYLHTAKRGKIVTASTGLDFTYDEVPYPDLCYGYTHPGRLAAIATLLNMQPVPVEKCRVLEIGTANGGNIIPMAFGLPDSTFVGIDLSARQIDNAKQFASTLGLKNITFHAMNLMDITPEFGQFDYIIVHGIYAWVPDPVKDKILSICHHNLSPNGIAYVSYNTLPGWHMILMVREMMIYHTRQITEPRQRAQAGREFIKKLIPMVPKSETSAYASFLKTYAEMRFGRFAGHEEWEDSTLLHDELSTINQPLYFHQFMEHAQQHSLQYLAEADFSQVMTHDLSDETVAKLHHMAHDTIELEQYLDFARHQTFRRTLLCHDHIDVQRTLRGEDIRNLYIASRAQLVSDNDGNEYFRTHDNSTYPAEHPVTTAAIRYLGEVSPRAVHFPALVAEACKRAGMPEPTEDAAETLSIDLLEAFTYSTQLAELLTYDPAFAPIPSERPKVSPIARLQVHHARIVSNLRHEQVELDGLSHAVMPFLDGQHDRADLLRELMEMVDAGQLGPSQQQNVPRQHIEQQLAHDLEYTLRWLGRAAVLLE